jgi:hypothetical protein
LDPLPTSVSLNRMGRENLYKTTPRTFDGKTTPYSRDGTYTLNSNCTGTMTLPREGKIPFTYGIVVVANGNEIDLMSTTPQPGLLTWVVKRIN